MSQKPKSRLGRGLSSLMSITEEVAPMTAEAALPPGSAGGVLAATGVSTPVAASDTADPSSGNALPRTGQIIEIPLDRIVPNPHQPRRQMDETTIAELAASIRSTGLIQPIIVRKSRDGYELIAGERRWRAARMAGLATVPVLLRDVNSIEQAQMALVENIQRENLNPVDRAPGLSNTHGATRLDAGRNGQPHRRRTQQHRQLSAFARSRPGSNDGGRRPPVHGPCQNPRWFARPGRAGTPGRDCREPIPIGSQSGGTIQTVATPIQRQAKETEPHLKDLEKTISQQLGLRVQVRTAAKKGQGKLILHYATLDQFDDLIGKLGVKIQLVKIPRDRGISFFPDSVA